MADRTTYYPLDFNRGELKPIAEATAAEQGIDMADLVGAEANALQRINQFILRTAGPVNGAVIVADYMDDTATLDPIIGYMAELIASAEVLERWERFNHGDEGQDGQTRRTDSAEVRGRATRIAEDIVSSGGCFKADKTFRRWFYAKGSQGPRAGGPLASGSQFDHRGYRNHLGELLPGPRDPYDNARRW